MKNFLFLILCVAALALPVSATSNEGVVNGSLLSDSAAGLVLSVSAAPVRGDVNGNVVSDGAAALDPETPLESAPSPVAVEEEASPLAVSGSLAGGYYMLVDCALGSDVMLYVPLEWATDVFTLDRSGAPVNLSNSTCYAYAPAFPDHTIQCSRFGTFTYRSSNYNTMDLMITEISDCNIRFLDDTAPRLSDRDLLVMICGVLFLFGACCILIRR